MADLWRLALLIAFLIFAVVVFSEHNELQDTFISRCIMGEKYHNYLASGDMPVITTFTYIPVITTLIYMPVITTFIYMPVITTFSYMSVISTFSYMPVITTYCYMPVIIYMPVITTFSYMPVITTSSYMPVMIVNFNGTIQTNFIWL